MTRLQRLLRSPVYRPWFNQVHPIFWPVLWWQLQVTIAWMKRTGVTDVMLTIHWWGGVEVVFTGDTQPDPSAYRPYVPTRPRFDDPCWECAVPSALAFDPRIARLDATSILPRSQGSCAGGAEGACSLTSILNTS